MLLPPCVFGCASHTTRQGDLAYLFITSANEKQWGKLEGSLKQTVESFRA